MVSLCFSATGAQCRRRSALGDGGHRTLRKNRQPNAAISLTTDTSALTAIGNDFSFDQLFARQVLAFGKTGDVAIGISTSGRSANVVRVTPLPAYKKCEMLCGALELGLGLV